MVVFESIKDVFDIVLTPFDALFGMFPSFKVIIEGIFFLSLSYFGWRAIK